MRRTIELSERHREVLEAMSDGDTNLEIAARLGLSDRTVKHHVSAILAAMGVTSRTKAVVLYLRAKQSNSAAVTFREPSGSAGPQAVS